MSHAVEATAFTRSFIDLCKDYRSHLPKYSLQVKRLEYGRVNIALIDRKQGAISREIFTPPQFNPVGWVGMILPSMKRDVSTSYVLTNLFSKVLGQPCDESTQQTEIKTLHSVLCAAPENLRKETAKVLGQNILVYQIIEQLQQQNPLSYCSYFCDIETQQCSFFLGEEQIPCVGEKFATWLWPFLQPDDNKVPLPSKQELPRWIAETNENLSFLLRTLALGASREVSSPVCRYLEALIPVAMPQQWVHEFRYEISFDEQPTVSQHVQSSIQADNTEPPILSVDWTVSLHFDSYMCPQSVKCTLGAMNGIQPELCEELRAQCSCEWQRTLLGDIEALFHRPDPKTFMRWELNQQARLFHIAHGNAKKNFREEAVAPSNGDDSVNPNLLELLESFNVPRHIGRKAFIPREFEPYLRDFTAPPNIVGILIAVSHLPFQKVEKFIEETHPQASARWTHYCSRIDITSTDPQVTVEHHAISTLREEGRTVGSISWSLKITLSPRGYPSDISCKSSVTGCINPLKERSLYQFAPPPYPLKSTIQEPIRSTVEPCISTPTFGIIFNRERLFLQKGADAVEEVLEKLGRTRPVPRDITETREKLLLWISSSMHPYARLLGALISAFSRIPLHPVTEFLQRVRPANLDEVWEHENESGEITVNEHEKTVEVLRTIRSKCRYNYFDLFQQPQSRIVVDVTWKLELKYDLIGQPLSGSVSTIPLQDCALSKNPEILCKRVNGTWISPPGYAIENVFRLPPPPDEIIAELLRMAPQVINEEDPPLIRVFEQGMQLVDLDRPGLELLMHRLNLPEELQLISRDQEALGRKLRRFVQNRSAWEVFMNHITLPVDFPFTPDNVQVFLSTLRECLSQRNHWKKCLDQRSKSCSDLPSPHGAESVAGGKFSVEKSTQEIEKRAAEQRKWEEIVRGIGIQGGEGGKSLAEENFLQRWRQHTQEEELTNILFLLGIAGGQGTTACMTSLIEQSISYEVDHLWKHSQNHIDINFRNDDEFEIIQQGRSSLMEIIDGIEGPDLEKEIVWLAWSLTMAFDKKKSLLETSSSVDEIQAPSLGQEAVENIVSLLSSRWDCRQKQETVCPLISVDVEAYQKEHPSPMQHLVRLPRSFIARAMNGETPSFLHNATKSSLDLNTLVPIIQPVVAAISTQHATQKHLPKDHLSGFQVIQSSVHLAEGEASKLCHSITTLLYSIGQDRQKTCLRKIAMVPWRIEFPLDLSGRCREVSVVNLDKTLMSESVARGCEKMLSEPRLDPLSCSMTVSRMETGL